MRKLAVIASFLLLPSGAVYAQEFSHFTVSGGAGFTQPVGNTGRQLDMGWNLQGGAGINFSPYFGTMLQLDYNRFGVNSFTLNNLGFPDGNLSVFSATVDPVLHLTPKRPMDVYVIGGGGLYHRNQEFTAPSVETVTAFNPFFGFYLANVPTSVVLASYSINKPGVNGGAGVSFGNKFHGKFFAEARYHRIFMGGYGHTDYVPVTFGFRY
jgi:hypothetical protein